MSTIVVRDYDSTWPETFEQIRSRLATATDDCAISIEHVGSTSVPGLAAKPIIDISIVVPTEDQVPLAIERLSMLGYVHLGNLGVEGREAFKRPEASARHNLYLCPRGSLALANHLALRDYLRAHPDAALEYGALKKELAHRFPDDIDGYTEGKTEAILKILEIVGFRRADLEDIGRINRRAV